MGVGRSGSRDVARRSRGRSCLVALRDNDDATLDSLPLLYIGGVAISPTGGVFSYLPHHLDLASEDSVGHSTGMSVLARRRAIMGSIVQPKWSCLGAATGGNPHTGGANNHTYPTAKNPPTTPPAVAARQEPTNHPMMP